MAAHRPPAIQLLCGHGIVIGDELSFALIVEFELSSDKSRTVKCNPNPLVWMTRDGEARDDEWVDAFKDRYDGGIEEATTHRPPTAVALRSAQFKPKLHTLQLV